MSSSLTNITASATSAASAASTAGNPKRSNAAMNSDSDNNSSESDDDGSTVAPPAAKSRKTQETGVVDPKSNISGGEIAIIDGDSDNSPCDCMLVKVNPNRKVDNFYVLQLIEIHQNRSRGYILYKRFGCTGTSGIDEKEHFDETEKEDAFESFEESFEELTGLDWKTNRLGAPVHGKYSFLQQNFTEKQRGYTNATFQYYIGDGVDGKHNGWHNYNAATNVYVEQLFHEYSANPQRQQQLKNRIILMGNFKYNLDLVQMTQTNIEHPNRTCRRIQRCVKKSPSIVNMNNQNKPLVVVGNTAARIPPVVATAASVCIPVLPTRTPAETIPYNAPINMIDIAISKIIPYTKPITESDNTCVICLSEMTDDEDIVHFDMPDCNHIYHHDCIKKAIQFSKPCCPTCRKPIDEVQGYSPSGNMSISTISRKCSGYESSIGTIVIRYDMPGDVQKQYHPNPNVRFHGTSRTVFIPDTQDGKELLSRLKHAWRKGLLFTVGTSMTTGASNCITWSSVHQKTNMNGGAIHHGFPDVNFFRNCNFELDIIGVPEASDIITLPQLNPQPMATANTSVAATAAASSTVTSTSATVSTSTNSQTLSSTVAAALRPMTAGATPSHQQIQAGLSILNEIKSKINGHSVLESYAALSSRFYTVIPHSFGRRRPPVISRITVVQATIDACHFLLQN